MNRSADRSVRRRTPESRAFLVILLASLVALAFAANVHEAWAYTPQKGDHFAYAETTTVGNGQGSYAGYTDKTQTTGMEQVNSVDGTNVSAYYSYSYEFINNQGNSSSGSSSGTFEWSSGTYTYVNGTDDQLGYSKPTYVWFAMNPSLSVGETFYVLNTQFTVLSKNYSLRLPTQGNQYVQTIQAVGAGQYQRNDSYGVFAASYNWTEFFDPSTGYIVGYVYAEQDNGKYQGQVGGFTYDDALYVTSTSYDLSPASAPTTSASTTTTTGSESTTFASYLIVLPIVLLAVAIVVYAATRRRRRESLPEHPYPPAGPPPSPSGPWESRIDLGSKPPEQVVIRDVAKVNCRYCGTLIPTTAERCPYCGGPRQ